MRAEAWADAVSMLLRFAASCEGAGARNSQCKAYLGAVVVWLYAGKARDAWVTYQVRLTTEQCARHPAAAAAGAAQGLERMQQVGRCGAGRQPVQAALPLTLAHPRLLSLPLPAHCRTR